MSKISERLAAIRARCQSATPGPWNPGASWDRTIYRPAFDKRGRRRPTEDISVVSLVPDGACGDPDCCPQSDHLEISEPDALFIAASRADLPALLAVVEAAVGAIDAMTRDRVGNVAWPWWGIDGEDGMVCLACKGDDEATETKRLGLWSNVVHFPDCPALALDSALAALGGAA